MVTQADVKQLIEAVETADTSAKIVEAVRNLSKACDEAAIPTLIEVLGFNNPGAAVAAVEGLSALGETAVPYLLNQIDGYNYGARAWAVRACANIGDPRALDLLLETASSDFALSVRRAATRGLGNLHWSNLPADEILPTQKKVLAVLLQVSGDSEWVVRYAAVVGLQSLGIAQTTLQASIIQRLEQMLNSDDDLTVQARVQMAIAQIKSPA